LAAPIRTRSNELLLERTHRTNYGQNEPINSAIRHFNKNIQYFDFCVSREGYRRLLGLKCTTNIRYLGFLRHFQVFGEKFFNGNFVIFVQ
jgi:hypothetical protein